MVLPLVIVSPWTLRNWVAFGELVPIRTGFGWNVYMGNPALGMTLRSESTPPTDTAPPWYASSALDAVKFLQQRDNERSLRQHAATLALLAVPAEYRVYNEAQRDAYYASVGAQWIIDHPLLAARFAIAKGTTFFFGWGALTTFATLLAMVGPLVHTRDPRAIGVTMLIVAYTVPYVLGVPFYYRYRAPIDPLVFILIGWVMARVNAWRAQGSATAVSYLGT